MTPNEKAQVRPPRLKETKPSGANWHGSKASPAAIWLGRGTSPLPISLQVGNSSHREQRKNMRQILVIEYDNRRPADGNLISLPNGVPCSICHLDLERNPLIDRRVNLVTCHRLTKMPDRLSRGKRKKGLTIEA